MSIESLPATEKLRIASLFSGIGGFEAGFQKVGHRTVFMCESDPVAQKVLSHHFPDVEVSVDIKNLRSLPSCDVVTAGWPCQDISPAGGTRGLSGANSGLISEVFRLIASDRKKPSYILLENVAFALDLHKGESISYVTQQLEELGYRWAYRILDTRAFGLPQRRRRLFVLAALHDDPAGMLFDGIDVKVVPTSEPPKMVGFYWTEGNRGLGWSPEAVPPLKGGSGLSIPSPPAIWDRVAASFVSPGVEDAERLQGFDAGWTDAADLLPKGNRKRWQLTGNAVSVPVAEWIGSRIGERADPEAKERWTYLQIGDRLPRAAYGGPGIQAKAVAVVNEGSANTKVSLLSEFGLRSTTPVSRRAISGFTSRFEAAPLRKNTEFLEDLRRYLQMQEAA